MTREEKIKDITRDFLVRDGQTFVYKSNRDRLGWDRNKSRFSGALYGKDHIERVICSARETARNLLVSMGIRGDIQVQLSDKGSRTDSKTVYVSTDMFTREDIDRESQLDIFMGFTIHEGAHILYTDFEEMRSRIKESNIHHLQNIIEDEYIERMVGEKTPGLANFLGATKNYVWGKYAQSRLEDDLDKNNDYINVVNAFLGLIRYPAMLTDEVIDRYYDVLKELKEVVRNYPRSTKEVIDAAEKCNEILLRHFKKQMEEEKKKEKKEQEQSEDKKTGNQSQNSPSSETEDNGAGEESDDTDNSSDTTNAPDGVQEDTDNTDNDSEGKGGESDDAEEMESEEEGDQGQEDDSDEDDTLTEEEKADIENEAREMLEKVLDDVGDFGNICEDPNISTEDFRKRNIRVRSTLTFEQLMAAEGQIELSDKRCAFFDKPKPGRNEAVIYSAGLNKVKRYVPAIRKALCGQRNETVTECMGLRSGTLDTRKLAEAVQGVQTVYTRNVRTTSERLAVCVLVDESGSMYGEKIYNARLTAILLEAALKDVPGTELYIYGHTADRIAGLEDKAEIRVFREKGFTEKSTLGCIDALANNRDGIAIEETAKRVRQQTSSDVLMFVISDGMPCAKGYVGWPAVKHVKDVVNRLETEGFSIMQIAIDSDCNSKEMFNNYIEIKRIEELPARITKEVSRAIARNNRRTSKYL